VIDHGLGCIIKQTVATHSQLKIVVTQINASVSSQKQIPLNWHATIVAKTNDLTVSTYLFQDQSLQSNGQSEWMMIMIIFMLKMMLM
jgi:hypothetical protein